jgi:hypothetical protein
MEYEIKVEVTTSEEADFDTKNTNTITMSIALPSNSSRSLKRDALQAVMGDVFNKYRSHLSKLDQDY